MQFLPCFLCGAKLEKRTTRKSKPYFCCDVCGIQTFVRRPHGIQLLNELLDNMAKNEIPFKQRAHQVYQIQALLTEINDIKQQIERLESQVGFFFPDQDKARARDLLKTKLQNLFKELEQLTRQDATKSNLRT
jgi:chaperonin cofactor prefoldin